MHRVIILVSLAIILMGITVTAAQQGPLIKIYTLTPDSPCASWLQMRASTAADTVGLVNAVRSAYIQGFAGGGVLTRVPSPCPEPPRRGQLPPAHS